MSQKEKIKVIATNKKAFHFYDILDRREAGLVLTGSEIKSIRQGKVNFKDSYVRFYRGEAYLVGLHIAPYEKASYLGHEPERDRKLLLHKREIMSLQGKVQQKGLTIIPLKIYLKGPWAKVEIALCRGKNIRDRREELKRKAIKMDIAREMSKYK
ncbi:SsrA-binding protein SmpB [Desulfothermus okinawensis JCM 13304]